MKNFETRYVLPIFQSLLILITLFNVSASQGQSTHKLDLHFTGLETGGESEILIAVYNHPDNFLSDSPFKDYAAGTNGNSDFGYILELPEGTYALAFFQDLNGNGKLDKNMIGYPKEPFAFSNNAPANFGPPKWRDAVFKIESGTKMKINF